MPIYKYTCPSCGKHEERVVKIADRDDQTCGAVTTTAASNDASEAVETACLAQLVREEISLNAKMGHSWQP